MKGILTTAMIVFAILTTDAQTMEKGYWNHLTQNENPKRPKPESIKFKGNKVIIVWNRREWERAQEVRKEILHRRGMPTMRGRVPMNK